MTAGPVRCASKCKYVTYREEEEYGEVSYAGCRSLDANSTRRATSKIGRGQGTKKARKNVPTIR